MSQPDGPVVHDTALILAAHNGGDTISAKEEERTDDDDRSKNFYGKEKAVCHIVSHLLQRLPSKSGDSADAHDEYGGAGDGPA